MVRLSYPLATTLLLVLAWPTRAAPLSLADAVQLAEQRSLQLPAHGAAAAAARAMAIAAGERPDPVLKASINNLPISGPDRGSLTSDFMTMRSVGVMQEWTSAGKLRARAARFEREAEVAEANRLLALANLQRDTAGAWLERHFQERLHEMLQQQRSEALLQVQAAEAVYRAGRGAQADVFAARSALALLDERLVAAERDVATAKTMLARWTGTPLGDMLSEPPSMASVRLSDAELESQLAHHPKIAVMLRQEAAAMAEADTARADKRPDLSVELMYSQRGSSYSNMVSIGVWIPLLWDPKHRQDRALAAKLYAVEQIRAQREEDARAHVAEARAMLQQWRSGRERLRRYDGELMVLANDRKQAALTAYRGATGSLAAVLEARRAEIDTRLERLRLEMDTARLWAQLTYLVPANHGNVGAQP